MPISEQEQRELEQEFESDLDQYMAEWKKTLGEHFGAEVTEAKDATGHQHKGKGEGGGQFTGSGGGGSSDKPDTAKKPAVADKHPWQMTRHEWEQGGMPDVKDMPDTVEAEKQAVNDFLGLFANPVDAARSGEIEPDESTWSKTRDSGFAPDGRVARSEFRTKLPMPQRLKKAGALPGEDARVAILNGRKLGYRDEDIAHYLLWNYVPNGEKILAGGKPSPAALEAFPALRGGKSKNAD